MNIIVTGATSFIGVHLIEELKKRDYYAIYAIVRPGTENLYRIPQGENVKVVELEQFQIAELTKVISKADVFYHLAWEGARMPYRDDKELQSRNQEAAVKAMETAELLGCTVFIGSGSQAEYGIMQGTVDESYPCTPNIEYGKAKYRAYQELTDKAEKSGIRFIWTRIFSIYGKYDFSGTLIMSCLEKMRKNALLELTACTQMWDYLHVSDAAKALALFVEIKCESGVYNLASGKTRLLLEFVNEMKEVLHSESKIRLGVVPYGPNGPTNLEPDVHKIKEALHWSPLVSFAEGIKMLLET